MDLSHEKGASTPGSQLYCLKNMALPSIREPFAIVLVAIVLLCEHVLSCPKGGYPSIRHDEIRDLTATLLSEVCHNVTTEPHLQPMTGEVMGGPAVNTKDSARRYSSEWGRFERTFFCCKCL